MGPRTHAAWLCTSVFDGARAFEGTTPDLDLHCSRINESAKIMSLKPLVPTETWIGLTREGLKRFDRGAETYIRPMYWAEEGAPGGVQLDPESTAGALRFMSRPFPSGQGPPLRCRLTVARHARPRWWRPKQARFIQTMRALAEARERGFDNCLLCDTLGNIAELGTANIFMVKDGVIYTPTHNGTFLAGITRARVIALLRESGATVVEAALRYADFQSAEEIFSTGNYTKVAPITRIDERDLEPGPVVRRAREYWEYARTAGL
jgi:branched-chain amino acid aminotransferase